MILNVDMNCELAAAFIARWQPSGGKELANYQSFLIELCTLLGVTPPEPTTTDDRHNAYVFERAVPSVNLCVLIIWHIGCEIRKEERMPGIIAEE